MCSSSSPSWCANIEDGGHAVSSGLVLLRTCASVTTYVRVAVLPGGAPEGWDTNPAPHNSRAHKTCQELPTTNHRPSPTTYHLCPGLHHVTGLSDWSPGSEEPQIGQPLICKVHAVSHAQDEMLCNGVATASGCVPGPRSVHGISSNHKTVSLLTWSHLHRFANHTSLATSDLYIGKTAVALVVCCRIELLSYPQPWKLDM